MCHDLGMDWIDMAAPIILHTRPLNLSFLTDSRMITLYGVSDNIEVTPVDTEELKIICNVELLR